MGGKVSKITEIRALGSKWARMGSQAPKILKNDQKMSSRASKITQNHENLLTQNPENPRKKNSRIQEIKMRHTRVAHAMRTNLFTYLVYKSCPKS